MAADSKASAARIALQETVRDEPQRRAYAFVNGETDSSPVTEAQAALEEALARSSGWRALRSPSMPNWNN